MSSIKTRSPGMTQATVSLSTELKKSLQKRAKAIEQARGIQFGVSTLIQLACTYQEKRDWKDIPTASTT